MYAAGAANEAFRASFGDFLAQMPLRFPFCLLKGAAPGKGSSTPEATSRAISRHVRFYLNYNYNYDRPGTSPNILQSHK